MEHDPLPPGWLRPCVVTRAIEPDEPPAPGPFTADPPPAAPPMVRTPVPVLGLASDPWPEDALLDPDRPPLSERSLRLPDFSPAVAVELSDGQTWWLPPIDDEAIEALPDLVDLIEALPEIDDEPASSDALAVAEHFDRGDWMTTVSRRIAGRLLSLNYRLPPHAIRALTSGFLLPLFQIEAAVVDLIGEQDARASLDD